MRNDVIALFEQPIDRLIDISYVNAQPCPTGLVIAALLAYLNHRFVGMPTTIGAMATALAFSLVLIGLDAMGLAYGLRQYEESMLRSIDFSDVLMQGMLSLLLFAGALHVHMSDLKARRWPVGILAVLGTVLSTLVVGFGMWFVLPLAGLHLTFIYCQSSALHLQEDGALEARVAMD